MVKHSSFMNAMADDVTLIRGATYKPTPVPSLTKAPIYKKG